MMSLNPKQPIATCESSSCVDCPTYNNLHCHFRLKDWIHFLFIAFPPFLLGGAGIYHVNGWLLIPWIIFVVAFFGFIEIRVMCSHCPHYAESDQYLKCWANYGSPVGFFMTLKMFMCSQCINFACPLNSVKEEVRYQFFIRNPSIAEAWGIKMK